MEKEIFDQDSMKVSESYTLPFKSEFDWRLALFTEMNSVAREALIKILANYKEENHDIEWKDEEALLNFARNENLFEKLCKEMEQIVIERY